VITVAHVSDTHFGGPPRAAERAHAVMDHLLALEPDVLVVSGDVADHGAREEYAEARAWLDRWPGPSLVVPGNHDVRASFVDALGSTEPMLDVAGVRLLGLDSLVAAPEGGRLDHGELDSASLDLLWEMIGSTRQPLFVVLHHPPVDLGQPLMTDILLRHPEELARLLAAGDQVVALLVGHCHTACATTFAGVPVLVGGATASVVPVEGEPLPTIWEGAPPSFALHRLDDDGRLTTHWRAL
jgi:3',5'-cyclic-AMP phosphodiesterase